MDTNFRRSWGFRKLRSGTVPPMRVLFTTTPGRGHYHPMLALADALAERGHEVAWAAADPVCVRLRELGFTAMPSGKPEPPAGLSLLDRYPEFASLPPEERPNFLFAKIFGPERAAPMLEDLLPLAREWSPSVMVCEQAELAGPIVAAALGIPNVTHGFGHPLPAARVARAEDAMQPLWEAHGLTAPPFAGTYQHLYVDMYPEALKAYGNEHIPDIIKCAAARPGAGHRDGRPAARLRDLRHRLQPRPQPHRDGRRWRPRPAGGRRRHARAWQRSGRPGRAAAERAGRGVHPAGGASAALRRSGLPRRLGHVPRRARPGPAPTRAAQAADQFLNARRPMRAGVAREIPPARSLRNACVSELEQVLDDPAIAAAARAMSAEIAAMPSAGDVADELARRYG